jgi:hypothetical protein
MDISFEIQIMQNQVVGAAALWNYSRSYFDAKDQIVGPSLPEMMLVLPIVFHKRTTEKLYRMRSASGLAKALAEDPEIPVGLQRRMEGLANATFSSLSTAVGSGLLQKDPEKPWPRYSPATKSLPAGLKPANEDVTQIMRAAVRLGQWNAQEEFNSWCSLLRVRF